ncbi:LuxR C-terminal-related transcriptional regulator [Aquiflexum sp. TKW24L]|uniref:helix-turn-helix transcriptional regulator n=1 Tax=Aquiflexum sp. TKW24L TaxID=2942212 RepID=UPI0020BFF08C|nr:LuxR C-terminal-related transcriptional regulator [Aquiflexum sp. TKW24L]MCL6258319.1 LuxR C-terminal-related transcriptional regulator [Aquiflexum sp. TKW24L]
MGLKEKNIIDSITSKKIELEKSKTLSEKQKRQYIIVIMFQQTGLTLIFIAVPISFALFQLSRLNLKSNKRKEKIFSKITSKIEDEFSKRLVLKFPNLSTNDIKLCELLTQNLSSKEIAVLLNISPGSVNTARYRLRKKFGLSADQDLLAFIHNF